MIQIDQLYEEIAEGDGLFCTGPTATTLEGRGFEYIGAYTANAGNIDRLIKRLQGSWVMVGSTFLSDPAEAITYWNETVSDWHFTHCTALEGIYNDIFNDFPGGVSGYKKLIKEVAGDLKKESGSEKTTTTPSGTETRTIARSGSETDTLTKSGSEVNQTVAAVKTETGSVATFDSGSYVGKDKEVTDGYTDTDTLSFNSRSDTNTKTFSNRQDTDTRTFTNRQTEEEKTFSGRTTSADYTETTTERFTEDIYDDLIRDIENRLQYDFVPMMIKWLMHDLTF